MSRFQNTSDKIYVGYNAKDLKTYSVAANLDATCKNQSVYDAINTEFNPEIVSSFSLEDQITPTSPFYGPNGISLQLTEHGNLYLQQYNETTNSSATLWSGAICNNNNNNKNGFLQLDNKYSCDVNGNIILSKEHTNIINPYCKFEESGNLTCYGCTISGGLSVPYMIFDNSNNPGSRLIINGSYSGIIDTNNELNYDFNKNITGNISILNSNNNLIYKHPIQNLQIAFDKTKDLQIVFDKTKECKNANDTIALSNDHNKHLAAKQAEKDANISYNIQYIYGINLGVGIVGVIAYICYLYKKK